MVKYRSWHQDRAGYGQEPPTRPEAPYPTRRLGYHLGKPRARDGVDRGETGQDRTAVVLTRLWVSLYTDRRMEALGWFARAADLFVLRGDPMRAAESHLALGHALERRGHHERALAHYTQARAHLVEHDLPLPVRLAACDHRIAHTLQELARPDEALDAFGRARALFARLGDVPSAAHCDLDAALLLECLGRESEARHRFAHLRRALPGLDRPWVGRNAARPGRAYSFVVTFYSGPVALADHVRARILFRCVNPTELR